MCCSPCGGQGDLLPHTALMQIGMKSWCLIEVASLVGRLVDREEQGYKVQIAGHLKHI